MKNKVLKICLTGLALSVAGLVNAETTVLKVYANPLDGDGGAVVKVATGNLPFVSTGIQFEKGELITIQVDTTDTVNYKPLIDVPGQPHYTVNPNGVVHPYLDLRRSSADYLVQGTVRYSLVGFIGSHPTDPSEGGMLVTEASDNKRAGFVGSNYEQTANASGYLYLAFNDDNYRDNSDYWTVTITTPGEPDPGPLASCDASPREAIAGGYISVAASSSANACLAAKDYVTIGAHTKAYDIYAGAAVTIGAHAPVDNIFSGAATTVGAHATTKNIHAGAAITLGAHSDVDNIYAGAATTVGAGAYSDGSLAADANITSTVPEDIHNAASMSAALLQIDVVRAALTAEAPNFIRATTTMGTEYLSPGVHQAGAVNVTASSTITFEAGGLGTPNDIGGTNYRWVMNFGTLTVGASTNFVTAGLGPKDTATIIWNVKTATIGASTSFRGTAFADGPFTAATAVVTCGNIYATGLISLRGIGVELDGTTAMCDSDAVFGYLDF
ncbi:hypothetical protein [Paraglaciecola sp. MB-3u-78]|uniref:hypothetical protein n=1 Tax=Paraglaciecola sp. MB-3u-78 TaxID=2058332 RepID=UPI000C31DA50|nr:hypothetical protein [Paraglaciecola sp. MB-3u-78]PKG98817.1 hypothetical protein CXF95_13290 [Paraglaciecola sp. MB-3u-78]